MEILAQDLKYAFRTMAKSRGLTAIAVLTLALGIGASTAVFSLINAILLKPLPYPQADRIVIPWRQSPPGLDLGYNEIPWGIRTFRNIQREVKSFQDVATFQSLSVSLSGSGDPFHADGMMVSAGFFPALGVSPVLGRTFTTEEDQPGRSHVVVLGDQLWRDRFGANPSIIGQAIVLNGAPYTVIGIMPAGYAFPKASDMPGSFNFPRETQLWVPAALPPLPLHPTDPDELAVIARLRPGVAIQQAQAEMDLIAKMAERRFPSARHWFDSRVTPLTRQVTGSTRTPLLLILGAVGVVLLIACSNVASLLLTRSIARRREFTVRAALGARQSRLLGQLLTESVLLSLAAGLVGVAFAGACIHFAKVFGPASIPRLQEASIEFPVLAFALGTTFLTGILCGFAPALSAIRENLVETLKESGQRAGGGRSAVGMRKTLVISEVALAFILVVAAGLLTQTFYRLLRADSGFSSDHVLTFELSLPESKYPDADRIVSFYDGALPQLRNSPGVLSAGIVNTLPMAGATESTGLRIPGKIITDRRQTPFAQFTVVSPGYFSAVGGRVVRGRDFRESDTGTSPAVTLINNAMARKFWPNEDPIGKQVGPGSPKYPLCTIIGIVADIKHLSLREEPGPEMYVLYDQKPWVSMATMQVAVRTKGDPAAVAASVRQAIHARDPELTLAKVASMTTLVDNTMSQPRFAMLLIAMFGGLALTLAAIGMYGVISFAVAQRTREIGVRMALGARRADVFAMVLREGARLAGVGISIGVVVAFAGTRVMSSFLYGIEATDPLTFAGVSAILAGIAMLACFVPARRATRVEPVTALRCE